MRKSIKSIELFIFLLFVINIPPAFFIVNSKVSYMYEMAQVLCFMVTFILYLLYIRKNKISFIVVLLCLFWLSFIISTIINHGEVLAAVKPFITTMNLCFTFEMLKKHNMSNFIKTANFYFKLIVSINLVTILLFPTGLYNVVGNENAHFFLGHKNNSIEYILPLILFANLNDYLNKKNYSFNNIYSIIISVLTVLLTWSANAILVIFYVILALYLPTKKIISKKVTCLNFFVGYLILFVAIVIYRLQYKMSWLIVGILHKSLTFTYRTYIWDKALYWIKKSLFFGYGYEDSLLKLSKIGHSNSCHNYLLDFMYMGGFLMIAILIVMLIAVFYKIKKCHKSVKYIITAIICGYFILWFATPIHKDVLCLMFLVFCIGYNILYLERNDMSEN